MFADPSSITIETVATSIPRRKLGSESASYVSSDDKVSVKISHTTSKSRTRRLVRLDRIVNYNDAMTGLSKAFPASAYLVIDVPARSAAVITPANEQVLATDLMTWLTASTNANLVKVTSSEI